MKKRSRRRNDQGNASTCESAHGKRKMLTVDFELKVAVGPKAKELSIEYDMGEMKEDFLQANR